MRFAFSLISLPALLCVTHILSPVVTAQAAVLDAAQATTLLAKSNGVNVKCNILPADQGQQLKDFVARAEISLAGKQSVAIARKAISTGRSEAQKAVCDDASRKMVIDVLAAASAAVVEPDDAAQTTDVVAAPVDASSPTPSALAVANIAPQPVKAVPINKVPVAKAKPTVAVKPSKISGAKSVAKIEKPRNSLTGYARVATRYYAALRCGTMSHNQIMRLYQTVLSSHQQAVASNSARDVNTMLRNAEATANGRSCG